jgi:peptidyl-prolyl cis-trans isomerase SurA
MAAPNERRRTWFAGGAARLLLLFLLVSPLPAAQEVVDRIVARIENDVILLSDVRSLSEYQLFVEGKSEGDAQILDRLIDQWIVRTEATAARTPPPSDADIERGLKRLRQGFDSDQDYESRRRLSGLSEADLRRITADQVFLNNYLESRFRPTVQVDEQAIQDFYNRSVVPRAQARGTAPPTLDAARDIIQEALVQRGINQQADVWLKESHARLRVTKMLEEKRP